MLVMTKYNQVTFQSGSCHIILKGFFDMHVRNEDSHKENALTNKTQVLPKSMNMYIWVISTLNRLFIRDSKFISGKIHYL